MNAFRQGLGWMIGGALLGWGTWACQATRNGDGSLTFKFAPDMTIRAWGMEDALSKMIDLRGHCQDGTFPRPCTQAEIDDISKSIAKIVEAKERMGDPESPTPGGSAVV